jgi:uncharacterized lipoprotein NlpE involved in copper resistance
MNPLLKCSLGALAALALAGCDRQAQDAVKQAGTEIKRETKKAGAEAKQALREVGATTGQVLEDSAVTAKGDGGAAR